MSGQQARKSLPPRVGVFEVCPIPFQETPNVELSATELRELVSPRPSVALAEPSCLKPITRDLGTQIVVLHRGWVVVGDVSQVGNDVTIANAKCIRRWGTTKGLGEIAANGPNTGGSNPTVLDDMGLVTVHELSVVLMLKANPEKWNGR